MATNTFAPSGFQYGRGSVLGAAPTFQTSDELIAYNYSSKIAFGDPVVLNASGNIVLYAAAGTSIYGIFHGCEYYDPVQQRYIFLPYWPAPGTLVSGQMVKAKVIVDPFAEFMVQVNGGPATQANVGENSDITVSSSGAPSAAGISTCSLSGTFATTNTLPFRVTKVVGLTDFNLGAVPGVNPSYNPTLGNNFVLVRMNTSLNLQTTGV